MFWPCAAGGTVERDPNVGPTMSTIFPMAVALLDAPGRQQQCWGPRGDSKHRELRDHPIGDTHQVKLLPGLTLAAQFLFTLLFGPLGLLMALPLAVVLRVIIREVLIHDVLIAGNARPAP